MTETDDAQDVDRVWNLVAQVVRTGPFPPPDGYDQWDDEAVWEQTVRTYEKKGGAIVAEAEAAAGGNREHLERRLLRTIRNILIDEAKATRPGLMRNRIATMLGHQADFKRVEGAGVAKPGWGRGTAEVSNAPWFGDRQELKDAAWRVPVPRDLQIKSAGPPPKATKLAMMNVINCVFDAADGLYIPDQDLAVVIADRFDQFLDAENRDATEFADPIRDDPAHEPKAPDPYSDVEAVHTAQFLWIGMSADERAAIPLFGLPDEDNERRDAVQTLLGCGPAYADALIGDLQAAIRTHCVDPTTARQVIDLLNALWSNGGSG